MGDPLLHAISGPGGRWGTTFDFWFGVIMQSSSDFDLPDHSVQLFRLQCLFAREAFSWSNLFFDDSLVTVSYSFLYQSPCTSSLLRFFRILCFLFSLFSVLGWDVRSSENDDRSAVWRISYWFNIHVCNMTMFSV